MVDFFRNREYNKGYAADRVGDDHMRKGNGGLRFVIAAATMLELVVVAAIALLYPSYRAEMETARASEPPEESTQIEQRLSAGMSTPDQPDAPAEGDSEPSADPGPSESPAPAGPEAADKPEPEAAPKPEPVPEKEKPAGELSAPAILAKEKVIAHGLGAIGDLTTPNCLESFQAAYGSGVRVFEADLRLTRDGQVILRHDYGTDWTQIPTREDFLSEKVDGRYTPLSFRDLLLLMERYPDICVITDSKFKDSDVFYIQFDAMLADAHELGLTYLFDRMFIQTYSANMKTALDNIYPFPHYIYTLYQDTNPFDGTEEDFRSRAALCREQGISGITMNDYWWTPAFAAIADEYDIHVYVHTVNDLDHAKELLEDGVNAVYTDYLVPGDLA